MLEKYQQLLAIHQEDPEFTVINSASASGLGGILSAYLATKSLVNELDEGWQTLEKVYHGTDKQEFFASLADFLQVTEYIPNSTITDNLVKSINDYKGIYTDVGWLFFDHTGDTLIWTSTNGGLELWDWQKGKSKGSILAEDKILMPIAVSKQNVLLTLSGSKLIKWDLTSGTIQPWQDNKNQNHLDIYSLLTAENIGIFTCQIITNAEGKEEVVFVISEEQDNGDKHLLKIYAPESDRTLKTYEIKEKVSAAFLDYDRKLLAYSTDSSTVYVMNIDTQEILTNFVVGDTFTWIHQIGFYGNMLVTADSDNNLKVWDINSGELITSWLTSAFDLAIHPQGKVFATINGYQDNIQLWRLSNVPQKQLQKQTVTGEICGY